MNSITLRRCLAAAFPGAFLLRKRCRCKLHIFGTGPLADREVVAVPCARCRRYAWWQCKQGVAVA